MRKVILCRIGWMTYYEGPKSDDPKPKGGGSYNVKHTGLEAYNFKKINKRFFGYVTTPGYKLNLRRIDPTVKENTLRNVLVIFIATKPKKGGQVVLGWYKNAKLFDVEQEDNAGQRDSFRYNMVASIKDAVLLPTYLRTFKVPAGTGGIGQANVAYFLNGDGIAKKLPWFNSLQEYIDTYDGVNLITDPEAEFMEELQDILEKKEAKRAGQGFLISGPIRKAVEKRAMICATDYYKGKKYRVEDVSSKKSYDLLCVKDKDIMHVEVKGTQGRCERIFVTRNEVKHVLKYKNNTALFIQYNIKVNCHGRKIKAVGGMFKTISPWKIKKSRLKALGYVYEL
ncbi:MAG: DUF3883 domain-containing protein [bacterium]